MEVKMDKDMKGYEVCLLFLFIFVAAGFVTIGHIVGSNQYQYRGEILLDAPLNSGYIYDVTKIKQFVDGKALVNLDFSSGTKYLELNSIMIKERGFDWTYPYSFENPIWIFVWFITALPIVLMFMAIVMVIRNK
jgi:hypothetical protein